VAGETGHENALHRAGESMENGYCESFNGRPRDECLDGEIFYSLKEAQIVIERRGLSTTRSGQTRRSDTFAL
jgi:putative transposase